MDNPVERNQKLMIEHQEHAGESLLRLSHSLVIETLKCKIAALTDPYNGIFGPLESTELGRLDLTPTKAEGSAPPALEGEEKILSMGEGKVFPTVSRGLGREGVGDGQGMSEEIQIGALERA